MNDPFMVPYPRKLIQLILLYVTSRVIMDEIYMYALYCTVLNVELFSLDDGSPSCGEDKR